MKIKERDGYVVDVFATYFIGSETMFLGLPRNHGGLSAYKMVDVEIIDNAINGKYVFYQNNGQGIYHWSLIEERLLDDLLELDEDAYKRFLEILKSEGQIEEDFY